MYFIPTKLVLPLPSFLTREYFETVTAEELLTREDFITYLIQCDELVTTSDEAQFYLDLFSILMVDEKFSFRRRTGIFRQPSIERGALPSRRRG